MNSTTNDNLKGLSIVALVILLGSTLYVSTLLIRQASAQTTHEVKISGFAFIPQNLTISLGDAITWNNTDPVVHTLWFVFVANGSTYLLSDPISPGTTWNYTFNDDVELQYYSFDKLWITGFINIVAEVHDVAVSGFVMSKTDCLPMPTVGPPYPVEVNATVENQGGFTETFNVTAYYDGTPIGNQSVTLNPGDNAILTFIWDTIGVVYGNYTLSATAHLPGDSDPGDNTFIDGWIIVTKPGDVNGDSIVDIFDAILLANAFDNPPGDPGWNPNADINGDQAVDIFDAIILANNFD